MKAIRSLVIALTLALLVAAPGVAAAQEQETITATFRLSLDGEVDRPEDRLFAVFYSTREQVKQSETGKLPAHVIVFCGAELEVPFPVNERRVSDEPCVGNGKTYSAKVEIPKGAELYVSFETWLASDPDETYQTVATTDDLDDESQEAEDFLVVNADLIDNAYYTFAERQAPQMPEAGAGGLAGDEYFPRGAVAAVPVLAVRAYVVRRRRSAG